MLKNEITKYRKNTYNIMSCYIKTGQKVKRDGILHMTCQGRYPHNNPPKPMKAEARMKRGVDEDGQTFTILRIDDANSPDFWLEVDIEEIIDNICKRRRIINSVVGNGNVFAGGVTFGASSADIA